MLDRHDGLQVRCISVHMIYKAVKHMYLLCHAS